MTVERGATGTAAARRRRPRSSSRNRRTPRSAALAAAADRAAETQQTLGYQLTPAAFRAPRTD
jgi:hypothetical protein